MDTENHNDSSNQRDIRNNTVEAMDTEEGNWKVEEEKIELKNKRAKVPINSIDFPLVSKSMVWFGFYVSELLLSLCERYYSNCRYYSFGIAFQNAAEIVFRVG